MEEVATRERVKEQPPPLPFRRGLPSPSRQPRGETSVHPRDGSLPSVRPVARQSWTGARTLGVMG